MLHTIFRLAFRPDGPITMKVETDGPPRRGLPRRLVSQGGQLKLEPLGSHRQPSTDIVDMHLEKQFQLSKQAITAMVDISNVFNLSEVSAVDTKFQDPTYGKPLGFTAARTFRLGLRYSF